MKRLMYMMLLSVLIGFPVTATAQADKPVMAKVDEPATAKPAKRAGPRTEADARECLKLATNMEIHRCAEKYR